mmetsp:Transcript_978/g.2464  ORF Transcript_978/g.2464 Transcript_978/m.2464 type:complete len:103 (+) Transcript_978:716-1024(+)
MGGTFLSLDTGYRDYFVRNLHDALSGHTSYSVQEAVKYSEQSNVKVWRFASFCLCGERERRLLYLRNLRGRMENPSTDTTVYRTYHRNPTGLLPSTPFELHA